MGRHARGSSDDALLLAYALPTLSNHVAVARYCPGSVATSPRVAAPRRVRTAPVPGPRAPEPVEPTR